MMRTAPAAVDKPESEDQRGVLGDVAAPLDRLAAEAPLRPTST